MKFTLTQACIEVKKGVFKCRATPYNLANVSFHWTTRKKWTDAWHDEVRAAVIQAGKKKRFNHAVVNITLYKWSLFDHDGAYNSVKPIVDGLKYAGVIIDDAPKYIDLCVKQVKVAHKKDEKVEIEVLDKHSHGS